MTEPFTSPERHRGRQGHGEPAQGPTYTEQGGSGMPGPARELRVVRVLLGVAVGVSVVHYLDNTLNYDAYPQPTSGPAPSQLTVGLSWFAFTAVAAAAYLLLRRERISAAAFCLAIYSGSGLVGIGHYTVPGATSMPWWRQADIVADITCGVALFGCALWLTRRARRRHPATSSTP